MPKKIIGYVTPCLSRQGQEASRNSSDLANMMTVNIFWLHICRNSCYTVPPSLPPSLPQYVLLTTVPFNSFLTLNLSPGTIDSSKYTDSLAWNMTKIINPIHFVHHLPSLNKLFPVQLHGLSVTLLSICQLEECITTVKFSNPKVVLELGLKYVHVF